jgi:drug/metabolite transporter (DMT)-like permease
MFGISCIGVEWADKTDGGVYRILELEGNNGKGLHPFQILFARMGITVILASLYMYYKKTPDFPFGAREVRPLLVARGLGGFFGVFGMYYSLLYLPLADATVITFLAPSIACWACSYILKEPFTRMEQIAAYVSLFGVVLIARPTSLFSGHDVSATPVASGDGDVDFVSAINSTIVSAINGTLPTTPNSAYDYSHVTGEQRAKGVAVAMLGVLGAASAFTTLRWIGKRAHALISVNYFATWCTIVSTVMMFALPGVGFLLPANLKEWSYLFFLGTCGFVMQFLLASGLQYEKSSRATNMVYTQMLFALGFDKLIFGTTPGWLSIVGSSLILGSAIYVAVQKDMAASSAGPVGAAASYAPVSQRDEEAARAEEDELDGLISDDDEDNDEDNDGRGIPRSSVGVATPGGLTR